MRLQKHSTRKIKCKSCGYSKKEGATVIGDCITPDQMKRISNVTRCPKCGSKDIEVKKGWGLKDIFGFEF
ncbi:hypothetical protein [Chitinivibrio alkaliphilus]|uniref:Uncharacterized protein n=1 Tax=Chitinivibrio alkaliphilus ACht1 TaxID=1313304 RepID=U7D2K1_9BACT|nr:hypothetical protein [Chitinivibrio alkaliphilus]ERP30734.1 hypothetical protein CALK_2423 [Chitinivibrio alkaliphilus ACht1]